MVLVVTVRGSDRSFHHIETMMFFRSIWSLVVREQSRSLHLQYWSVYLPVYHVMQKPAMIYLSFWWLVFAGPLQSPHHVTSRRGHKSKKVTAPRDSMLQPWFKGHNTGRMHIFCYQMKSRIKREIKYVTSLYIHWHIYVYKHLLDKKTTPKNKINLESLQVL